MQAEGELLGATPPTEEQTLVPLEAEADVILPFTTESDRHVYVVRVLAGDLNTRRLPGPELESPQLIHIRPNRRPLR